MADSNSITVWHYTNCDSLSGILDKGIIYASTDNTVDAVFGKGVYATALHPDEHTWKEIAKNNYDDGAKRWKDMKKNTRFAIGITAPKGFFKKIKNKTGRDIYIHKGNIHLASVEYEIWEE